MTFIDEASPLGAADDGARPLPRGLSRWDRWLLWWALLVTRRGLDPRTPETMRRSSGRIAKRAGLAWQVQASDPDVYRDAFSHAAADRAGYFAEQKVQDGVSVRSDEVVATMTEQDAVTRLEELRPDLASLRERERELEDRLDMAAAALPDPEPEPEPPPQELIEEQDDAQVGFRASPLMTVPLVLLGTGLDAATTVPLAQHVSIGLPGVSIEINQLFPIGVGLAAAASIPVLAHRLGRVEFRAAGEPAEPAWMLRRTALALYAPLAILAGARALTLGSGEHGTMAGALLGLALGLLVMLVARVAVREGFRAAAAAARTGRIGARSSQRDSARRRRRPLPTAAHLLVERIEKQLAETRARIAAITSRTDELRTIAQLGRDERLTARVRLAGLEAESTIEAQREAAMASSIGPQFAARRDAVVARRVGERPASFAEPATDVWRSTAEMPSFRASDLDIPLAPPTFESEER